MSTLLDEATSLLLEKVNRDQQPSIMGCVILAEEAEQKAQQAEQEYRQMELILSSTEAAIRRLHRELTELPWRALPGCGLHKARCRTGICGAGKEGCSYGLIGIYSTFLRDRDRYRCKQANLRQQAHDLRVVRRNIIIPQLQAACQNEHCRKAFIDMAYIVGDIADHEWWFAQHFATELHGGSNGLALTIHTTPVRRLHWTPDGVRAYNR